MRVQRSCGAGEEGEGQGGRKEETCDVQRSCGAGEECLSIPNSPPCFCLHQSVDFLSWIWCMMCECVSWNIVCECASHMNVHHDIPQISQSMHVVPYIGMHISVIYHDAHLSIHACSAVCPCPRCQSCCDTGLYAWPHAQRKVCPPLVA